MRKTTHTRILAGAALLFLLLFVPEGAGAQRVYKSSLPREVQESFRLAHPKLFPLKIVKWDWTSVGYCARYNFPYNEVMSLFQTNGEWVSTRSVIPEATLPLRAHDFISAKYAFYNLRSCTYEEDRWQGRHYYALFSIRGIPGYMTEVCFDMQGNVVSIDGTVDEDWDNFEPLNEEEVLLLQAHQTLPEEEVLSSVRGYEERGEDNDEVEEDEDAEPSIGFFAWREDYAAMKQKKKEEREQKTSAFEEKWLSFLAKLKIKINTEEEESAEQQQEDFQKEKDRQTNRLYRPQSRRDFSYAQVMVQSKTAQKKQASEDEKTVAERVKPVEETPEPVREVVEPVKEVEESIEPVEEVTEPVEEPVELVAETVEPVEEVIEPIEEVIEPVELVAETIELIEEVIEPVEEIIEPVEQATETTEEPVEQPVEQLAETTAEPATELATEPEIEPATEPATPTPLVRTEGMQSSLAAANVPSLTISAKTLLPDDIQETFDKRFPKAERVKYFRDTNTDYRAVFTNFGQKAEAVFLHDGTHITTALFFGKKDISYPIRQYIDNQPNKPKFVTGKRVVYESRYRQRFTAAEKPQNYYEVVVWEKNKDKSRDYYLLRFDHKGHFVSSTPYDYVGSR